MKPQLHKLPLINDTSFLYNKWQCNYFDKPWHFHEEYELVLIEKSKGTKFIGDKVSVFNEEELILIGSNIPHLFRNSQEYYKTNASLEARSVFIHFKEDFLGPNFFDLPEMKTVRKLLDNSAYALQINGKIRRYIISKMYELADMSSALRLVTLLEMLVKLADSKELKPLLSTAFVAKNKSLAKNYNPKDTERIHKVFDFIMRNYRNQMYLNEVASMLNMSNESFSRYFKHHTRKTFSEYVTEIRISHACNMLMEDDEGISQICFSSGFENLPNFYRHFRKITGMIPKEYRQRFLKTPLEVKRLYQKAGV